MPGSDSLRVGGFVPFTTIDYPGELAAVVFLQGCPWRCSYCHNTHLQPVCSTESLSWRSVLGLLKQRQGLLDAVVFSGGEPTSQRGLRDAMLEVKALGFKLGLHTAGIHPERLQHLLPLLDWAGLDIKELPEHYPDLTGAPGSGEKAWRSLLLLHESGVPFQARTTLYPGLPQERLWRLEERLREHGVADHCLQPCR